VKSKAQIFCGVLIFEYLLAAALFGADMNWKKAIYYVGCAVKDLAILLL